MPGCRQGKQQLERLGDLLIQARGDLPGPHGGKLSQHHGQKKEEKPDSNLDAGDAGGFYSKHQNRDDKDIQHGPFAQMRDEFIKGPGPVGGQSGIKPQREQAIHFHERKTDGEHKEDEKQKQLAGVPQDDQTAVDGNLVIEQPEFCYRGERKKDSCKVTTQRRQ